MRAALRLVAVMLLGLLVPGGAGAQADPDSPPNDGLSERIEELRERARGLEEVRGHDAANDALEHARRALIAARVARREGRERAAERSVRIAEAALTLADRLAGRRRAHLALEQAREREEAARARAATAREALEAALRERARARRERAREPEGEGS